MDLKSVSLSEFAPGNTHTHTHMHADEHIIHKHSEGKIDSHRLIVLTMLVIVLSYTCTPFSLNDAQRSISQVIFT